MKIFISLLVISGMSFGEVGTTVFDFLNIPNGARFAAMGGTCVTLSSDPYSLFSNPAGLFNTEEKRFAGEYTNYIAGIQKGSLVYTQPIAKGVMGVGINYLYYGKFIKYDKEGKEEGEFIPMSLCPTIGYARTLLKAKKQEKTILLTPNIPTYDTTKPSVPLDTSKTSITPDTSKPSVTLDTIKPSVIPIVPKEESVLTGGISLKAIYEDIDVYRATGVAIDAGVIYYPPKYKKLAIGAVVQNLGLETTVFNIKENLPVVFKVGVSFTPSPFLTGVLNFSQPVERKFEYDFGVEWKLTNLFTLRAGHYSWGNDLKADVGMDIVAGWALGMGFEKDKLNIDYSLTPKVELGFVHRLSLSWKM